MGYSDEDIELEMQSLYPPFTLHWQNLEVVNIWVRFGNDLIPDSMTGSTSKEGLIGWLNWLYPNDTKRKLLLFDDTLYIAKGAYEVVKRKRQEQQESQQWRKNLKQR